MFKQIIFDCDGVIVDTEIVAAEVMTNAFSSLGIDISIDQYLNKYTGKTITNLLNILLSEDRLKEIDVNKFTHQCDKDIYDRLRPVEGMADVVRSIALPKAVASNSRLWQVEKAIDHVGLVDQFDKQYFSSEMVENPKPSPDVYLLAAQTLNIPTQNCLVIEDSKSGVRAAATAGMTVIGFGGASHIKEGHDKALKENGAQYFAASPEELQAVLKELL